MKASEKTITIVGGGLAGSILAFTLIRYHGTKVHLIDNSRQGSSSVVAAGLANPITGKRMAKTWMAKELFHYLPDFYRDVERLTGGKYWHPHPITKPFDSVEEQNYWSALESDPRYSSWISLEPAEYLADSHIPTPYGGITYSHSGWVDCMSLLQALSQYIQQAPGCTYRQGFFATEYLAERDSEAIVYCEGHAARHNPLWDWLPWQVCKGEILQVRFPENFTLERIVNKSVFICPTATPQRARVGSTYINDFDLDGPTEEGLQELTLRLGKMYDGEWSLESIESGIRPSTRSRRPFIGEHPMHPRTYIFNGFGSKGSTMIPFFAKAFAAYLLHQSPLPPEVSISKFYPDHTLAKH